MQHGSAAPRLAKALRRRSFEGSDAHSHSGPAEMSAWRLRNSRNTVNISAALQSTAKTAPHRLGCEM